jgi:hypothetical protein
MKALLVLALAVVLTSCQSKKPQQQGLLNYSSLTGGVIVGGN